MQVVRPGVLQQLPVCTRTSQANHWLPAFTGLRRRWLDFLTRLDADSSILLSALDTGLI